MLLLVLNLAGTFAFGLSGGMAGVRARLDLFGVVVLAVVVGLAGGITRDLLIGVPPATIRDWRYLAVAGAAGLVTLLPTRSSAGLEGRSTCWTRPDSRSSASLVRVPHSTMASPPYPPSSSARSRASAAASSATFSSARSRRAPRGPVRDPCLIGAAIVVGAARAGAHGPAAPIIGAAVCL
jgi:hypothetical protein